MQFGKLVLAVALIGAAAGAWQALGAEDAKPIKVEHAMKPDSDPYLWLADIHGKKALDWVALQNAKSNAVLKSDPNYTTDRATILADARTPRTASRRPWSIMAGSSISGRTRPMCAGCGGAPRSPTTTTDKPNWQTLLDIDKLDKETGKNWVWKGADCTPRLRSLSGARCRPAAATPS